MSPNSIKSNKMREIGQEKYCSIQLFHACLGNSENCCPEVPWTARCISSRGWMVELSTVPRGSSFVYSAKQPWNNCFITQPMLKILDFASLIDTRRRYTLLDVILMLSDVINQAIDKTIDRCFSIMLKWVTSQTWGYSQFYGPACDVIWATLHVFRCGACQLNFN